MNTHTALMQPEQDFCAAYVRLGQVLPAMEEAGLAYGDAADTIRRGRKILNTAAAKDYISGLNAYNLQQNRADTQAVVQEYLALAQVDIGQVLSWRDGVISLRDLDLLPPHVRKAIQEVTIGKDGGVKVKLMPRAEILGSLSRMLGLFRDEVKITVGDTEIDPATMKAVGDSLRAKLERRKAIVNGEIPTTPSPAEVVTAPAPMPAPMPRAAPFVPTAPDPDEVRDLLS